MPNPNKLGVDMRAILKAAREKSREAEEAHEAARQEALRADAARRGETAPERAAVQPQKAAARRRP